MEETTLLGVAPEAQIVNAEATVEPAVSAETAEYAGEAGTIEVPPAPPAEVQSQPAEVQKKVKRTMAKKAEAKNDKKATKTASKMPTDKQLVALYKKLGTAGAVAKEIGKSAITTTKYLKLAGVTLERGRKAGAVVAKKATKVVRAPMKPTKAKAAKSPKAAKAAKPVVKPAAKRGRPAGSTNKPKASAILAAVAAVKTTGALLATKPAVISTTGKTSWVLQGLQNGWLGLSADRVTLIAG